jgi:hypothetical protein
VIPLDKLLSMRTPCYLLNVPSVYKLLHKPRGKTGVRKYMVIEQHYHHAGKDIKIFWGQNLSSYYYIRHLLKFEPTNAHNFITVTVIYQHIISYTFQAL